MKSKMYGNGLDFLFVTLTICLSTYPLTAFVSATTTTTDPTTNPTTASATTATAPTTTDATRTGSTTSRTPSFLNNTRTRKALFGESCRFDDDLPTRDPLEYYITCDSHYFFMCSEENICRCFEGLQYDDISHKCIIPVGEMCSQDDLMLPAFMDYSKLKCNYGECRKDNGKHICRPATDKLLLIVNEKNKD